MTNSKNPIGFFDSGIGGLSVLKEAIKLLPNEDFIYFGDSKNAPYGIKHQQQIKELTFAAVDRLLENRVKAIVIACNTATSVTIEDLRKEYKHIPIIGIEPALKPAVEITEDGKIVIMATPITLKEKKFNALLHKYNINKEIIPMPCPGLVELIEQGQTTGKIVKEFLYNKFERILNEKIGSVVLGCTHYPFIREELNNLLGNNVSIIDGSLGTSKQLYRQLKKYNLLYNDEQREQKIVILNSLGEKSIIDLSYKLLNIV